MGHRLRALNLEGAERLWSGQGLEFVMGDSLSSEPRDDAPATSEAPSAADAETEQSSAAFFSGTGGRAARATQPAARTSRAGTSSGSEQPGQPDESNVFFGPWKVALERARPGTRVLLTYWELALDFGQDPSDERRALWANIVRSLPCKDVLSFWPISHLRAGKLIAEPGLFWAGAERLGAKKVLCFGRKAHQALFPLREYGYDRFENGGIAVHVLPGPEDMLPDNRQAKAVAWNILKNVTSD